MWILVYPLRDLVSAVECLLVALHYLQNGLVLLASETGDRDLSFS